MYHAPRYLLSFPTRRSSDLENDSYSRSPENDPPSCAQARRPARANRPPSGRRPGHRHVNVALQQAEIAETGVAPTDRKSTRLNSSHVAISYAVFCLKKKNNT